MNEAFYISVKIADIDIFCGFCLLSVSVLNPLCCEYSRELKFIPVKPADVFPQRAVRCAAVIYVKLIITASVGVYKLLNIRINFIHH